MGKYDSIHEHFYSPRLSESPERKSGNLCRSYCNHEDILLYWHHYPCQQIFSIFNPNVSSLWYTNFPLYHSLPPTNWWNTHIYMIDHWLYAISYISNYHYYLMTDIGNTNQNYLKIISIFDSQNALLWNSLIHYINFWFVYQTMIMYFLILDFLLLILHYWIKLSSRKFLLCSVPIYF